MLRAYQSPASGTHCGLQWAQIPNFASRYHSGASYSSSESHVGLYGPSPARFGIGDSMGTPSQLPPGMGSALGSPHADGLPAASSGFASRSEEHTSEPQSLRH